MNVTIDTFPDELLINIFSYLEPKELADTALVSKKWNTLSCDNILWKNIIKRMPLELEYEEKGIKHALSQIKQITNFKELTEDFQTFSDCIDENRTAFYECLFVKNPPSRLNIQFGVIKEPAKATKVVRKVLFTKKLEHKKSIVYQERSKNFKAWISTTLNTHKELLGSKDREIYDTMSFFHRQTRNTERRLQRGREKEPICKIIYTVLSVVTIATVILGIASNCLDFARFGEG